MSAKRQCSGTITNPKSPNLGAPCRKYAVNGSDRCAVHGGAPLGGFADADSLEHRCIATTTNGERCKKAAIRGATVCRSHGGATKQVQRKARELLDRMVEPALHTLREVMLDPASSDSDKLRSVQMLLDRTGFGPGLKVEHEVKQWEVTMRHMFSDSGARIDRRVPANMLAELEVHSTDPRVPGDDIEDAELVDDHDEDLGYRHGLPRIIPPRDGETRGTIRRPKSANPPKHLR